MARRKGALQADLLLHLSGHRVKPQERALLLGPHPGPVLREEHLRRNVKELKGRHRTPLFLPQQPAIADRQGLHADGDRVVRPLLLNRQQGVIRGYQRGGAGIVPPVHAPRPQIQTGHPLVARNEHLSVLNARGQRHEGAFIAPQFLSGVGIEGHYLAAAPMVGAESGMLQSLFPPRRYPVPLTRLHFHEPHYQRLIGTQDFRGVIGRFIGLQFCAGLRVHGHHRPIEAIRNEDAIVDGDHPSIECYRTGAPYDAAGIPRRQRTLPQEHAAVRVACHQRMSSRQLGAEDAGRSRVLDVEYPSISRDRPPDAGRIIVVPRPPGLCHPLEVIRRFNASVQRAGIVIGTVEVMRPFVAFRRRGLHRGDPAYLLRDKERASRGEHPHYLVLRHRERPPGYHETRQLVGIRQPVPGLVDDGYISIPPGATEPFPGFSHRRSALVQPLDQHSIPPRQCGRQPTIAAVQVQHQPAGNAGRFPYFLRFLPRTSLCRDVAPLQACHADHYNDDYIHMFSVHPEGWLQVNLSTP